MVKYVLFALALLPAIAVAQNPIPLPVPAGPLPLARNEIDTRAAKVAYDAVLAGVELFNSGNVEDCLRVYQATVNALAPFLDHRPELVKIIEDKVTKSKGLTKPADKAFALREALDAIMATQFVKKPLWERMGGQKAVETVVHEFFIVAKNDPKVNITRDGRYKPDEAALKKLETLSVELISEKTGGPLKYTGQDMKKAHAGMKITDAEFDAMANDLKIVLIKNKIAAADIDELMAIVETTRADIVEVKK